MTRRSLSLTLALILGLTLLGAGSPVPSAASIAANAAACATFPETGKAVCGRFLEYWQANGGLAQQGFPLTDEFMEINPTDQKPYLTQYFERARFELHPLLAPPYDVLLGLVGREQYLAKYPNGHPVVGGDPFNDPRLPQECATFAETGKQVCGPFLVYWREHGGLAQQGLPLTNLFLEANPTSGGFLPTQYFERARFEWHADLYGTPYAVLLGRLGDEQLKAKYPNGLPTSPVPSASPLPPAPSAAPTSTPTRTPTKAPAAPTATPTKVPTANCDPSYPTVCIPPPPPDLDCGQIPYRNFVVKQPDPHRFDSDKDGIGCET